MPDGSLEPGTCCAEPCSSARQVHRGFWGILHHYI